MTAHEMQAARLFREQQRQALAARNENDPPDITVSVFVRQCRHACPARGPSVALQLREHYARSPEYRACYCGTIGTTSPEIFPHPDCDGSVTISEAGKFGFIWTEGRCTACSLTARSGTGRLVDSAIRPPAPGAITC